jgi:hypothetical protein
MLSIPSHKVREVEEFAMTNQRARRALIGFITFSVICMVLITLAWQSPARHRWRVQHDFAALAPFPYLEKDKLTAVRCLATQNDSHALPLARTISTPEDRSRAFVAIAQATQDTKLFKEALATIETFTDKGYRNVVLGEMTKATKDTELLRGILNAAKKLNDDGEKLFVFLEIAQATADNDLLKNTLDALKNTIKTTDNPYYKSRYITELSKITKNVQMHKEALRIAKTLTFPEEKVVIFVDIAGATKNKGLLREALRLTRKLAEPHWKALLLAYISNETKDVALLKEATLITKNISDPFSRSFTLMEIAKFELSHALFRSDPEYRKELIAQGADSRTIRPASIFAYDYSFMGNLAEARSFVKGSEVERLCILSSIQDGLNKRPFRDYAYNDL